MLLWILLSAVSAQTLPDDAADLSARAAKAYREGKVAEARSLYESALARQARCAPALAGLGRIDLIEHRRQLAVRKLALAYQLTPDDPGVVRDFALATDDKALEKVLLQRLVNLRTTSPVDRDVAKRKLAIHSKLAGRATNVLLSAEQPYRLRMPVLQTRDWRPYGWALRVRINNMESPLQLLVDTGARGMLLFRTKGLDLEPLTDSVIGGFGGSFGEGSRQPARTMLARNVRIDGQLELGNVVVEAVDRQLVDGVDGLISPDVFERFLVTFDGQKKVLELTPFPPEPLEGFQPARRVGHLWIVEKAAGEQFVLDTGSSYTVIHEPVPSLNADTISLFGVSGEAKLARVSVPVEVSLGGSKAWTKEAVCADLEPISEQLGMRISGFLGFPALRRFRLSLDFRNHSIRVQK